MLVGPPGRGGPRGGYRGGYRDGHDGGFDNRPHRGGGGFRGGPRGGGGGFDMDHMGGGFDGGRGGRRDYGRPRRDSDNRRQPDLNLREPSPG